jgi:hypothetical protein
MMDNVSRPLIALLAATVALFALYFVALRGSPKSASSSGTSSQSLKGYQSDISSAQHAVAVSGANDAASGGANDGSTNQAPHTGLVVHSSGSSSAAKGAAVSSTASSGASSASTSASSTSNSSGAKVTVTVTHSTSATQHRLKVVDGALASKKVLAILFYNPAGADDRAVKQELALVPTHHKLVVKVAVPISELARYQVVTTQVPVSQSPTLVLIDRTKQATTIVGYASSYEIAQRVDDALAVK